MLLVSRNLERVADLATNIGEDAVFLAEGKQIKHHAEKRSSPASTANEAAPPATVAPAAESSGEPEPPAV